jgi:ribose transport system permease protein
MRARRTVISLLNSAPAVLFVGVFLLFGLMAPRFLEARNLMNILTQTSATAIVAVGMTFVLLTGGVDLSVGAIMFVVAALTGKLVLSGAPLILVLPVAIGVALVFGAVNGLLITRCRLVPFIVTLATLFIGRGVALWITETRAMNLPDGFVGLGTFRWLGIPLPLWVLLAVLVPAHLALARTPFGRQIYALGNDARGARTAGVPTGRLTLAVYLVSAVCAAIAGVVSLAQLGAVSPTFGWQKEFGAIAAAVLGGTSLFGGRGRVFPGTILGAVLIQTIENGLVIVNADPYLYPLVTSAIIFLAVLIDSTRGRLLAQLSRRKIRAGDAA